jgi:hypothetical protein
MRASGSSKALPSLIEAKLSALNGAMQHGNTEPLAVIYITVQGRMQRDQGCVSTVCCRLWPGVVAPEASK